MSSIQQCDEDAISSHTYSVGTVAPCVTLPLTLALVVIPYCWWLLWRERKETSPAMKWLCCGDLSIHSIFTLCCWIQCIAMLTENRFVGGASLCEFQGWYAGFYVFSETILSGCALNIVMSVSLNTTQAAVITATSILLGMFLASLPLLGVGNYVFATFCTINLEDPTVFGWMFVLIYIAMIVCVVVGPLRIFCRREQQEQQHRLSFRSKLVCIGAAVMTLMGWSAALVMACAGLIRGSSCEENFGSMTGIVYGVFVTLAHLQNVVNPVLYGVLIRRSLPKLQLQELQPDDVGDETELHKDSITVL